MGRSILIATDHAPHHYDAKDREFADAPFGIVGLETALALVVTELVESGMIDFKTLVDRMSTRPARLFGLPGGTFAKGSIGDVTVFDPKFAWQVDPSTFLSKGRNTPYVGKALRGRARYTVVGGAAGAPRGRAEIGLRCEGTGPRPHDGRYDSLEVAVKVKGMLHLACATGHLAADV